jgi:CRP-like cAMP-binding protein
MAGVLKKYLKGEAIIAEGTEGKAVFIIRDGQVEVIKQNPAGAVHLATLGAGEVFGEMSMIDDRFTKRTATVRAIEDSEIIVLDKKGFEHYLQQSSTGIFNLIKRLSQRLRETNDIIARAGIDVRNLPKARKVGPDDDGKPQNLTIDQMKESVDAAVDLNLLPKKFKAGQVLVREGAEAMSVFLLKSGTVTVTKRLDEHDVELDRLCANEVFGETAMFGEGKRFATVTADEEGEVVVFSRNDMDSMLRKAPLELFLVMECLSQKLQRSTLRYLDALRELDRSKSELSALKQAQANQPEGPTAERKSISSDPGASGQGSPPS